MGLWHEAVGFLADGQWEWDVLADIVLFFGAFGFGVCGLRIGFCIQDLLLLSSLEGSCNSGAKL